MANVSCELLVKALLKNPINNYHVVSVYIGKVRNGLTVTREGNYAITFAFASDRTEGILNYRVLKGYPTTSMIQEDAYAYLVDSFVDIFEALENEWERIQERERSLYKKLAESMQGIDSLQDMADVVIDVMNDISLKDRAISTDPETIPIIVSE